MKRRFLAIRIIYSTVVLAAVGFAGIRLAPYIATAGHSARDVRPGWLALAVAAELWSMAAFARLQRRLLAAAGTKVAFREVIAVTYAANALSVTLPGGTALSSGYAFRRFRRDGATVPAATFALLASSALSAAAFGVLAVLCGAGSANTYVLVAAVLVTLVGATVVWFYTTRQGVAARHALRVLERFNRSCHRDRDRGKVALQQLLTQVRTIRPTRRDWFLAIGFALLNWLADVVTLIASLHAIGAKSFSLPLILATYVVGISAASASLIPAGIGVADAAMVVVLVNGGLSANTATAGLLIYRVISMVFVLAAGWVIWSVQRWFSQTRHLAAAGVSVRKITDSDAQPSLTQGSHSGDAPNPSLSSQSVSIGRATPARRTTGPRPTGDATRAKDHELCRLPPTETDGS